MSASEHMRHAEDVGAYLLGALPELEERAFERHVMACAECRDEIERLRPAAELLPRSVEQFEPPPGLRRSLMSTVEAEARERAGRPHGHAALDPDLVDALATKHRHPGHAQLGPVAADHEPRGRARQSGARGDDTLRRALARGAVDPKAEGGADQHQRGGAHG